MIFYELNKQQKVVGIVSSAIVEATLEEAINTAGKLKFTTSSKLRDDCYYILLKRPNAETYMCFKILTETQNNNQVEYTAVESAYDELASYSYIKDIRPQNHSAKEMLTQILSVTRYQVGYVADTPGKTTNFYYKSVLESLQELTNLFGLEITFDVAFDANDNQIKRRLVNLYHQQGNRTGKRFEYGDKLLSVTKEQSSEELVTALVGRGSSVQVSEGSDGSPDGYSRKITFADIEWKKASGNPLDKPLGQEFLEDPSATALYGFSDGKPRIGIVEFSNIKDKNELLQATYEKLQELKRPKVSFKAAVTDVGELVLGDTVAIIRHDLQIEYLTRVYKVTHNLLNERDNTVEFGDSFQSASITNKLSNIQQDVQSARERSESAVQAANGKNTNFYSSSKPSSAIEGDLWYKDLSNGETELYAWHNGNWELVVSTADTTAVKRQVEQAQLDLAQVRADATRISETQTESAKRLDEQMQALQAKTVDNATNVQNVIRDVAQAHTDYVNQQADISKQKADLEKAKQSLQTTSQGLDQARQDLLSNSTRLDKLEVGVNGVTVNVNNLNTKVDNIKVGARNLLKNSDGQFVMGYGITNTTWENGKAVLRYNSADVSRNPEILPQSADFSLQFPVTRGEQLTQSIYLDTDANINPNNNFEFTWFDSKDGHQFVRANIDKIGQNTYRLWGNYTWDKNDSSNLRIMDISGLYKVVDFRNSGTYLAFYHPQIERSSIPSDYSPAPEEQIEKVAQLKVDLDGIRGTVATAKGDIAQIELTENGMQQNIKDAQGNISTLQNDAKQFKQQFSDVNGNIANLSASAKNFQLQMQDAQGNISNLQNDAKGFKQQFADTNGNIATIKRNATELSEQLASKVGNAEYQSFKTQTAKELSQKLVRTDLNGYATTAEVKLTADGLKEQYNSVNSKIDGLKIGGRNLLDGTADFNSKYWYAANGTADIMQINGKTAVRGLKNWEGRRYKGTIDLEPNTDYTVSVYVRVNGGSGNGLHVGAYCQLDGTETTLGNFNTGTLSTEWKRVSLKWHNDSYKKMTTFRIEWYGDFGTGWGSGFSAELQLEKGNKPSDWGMSDNDINQKVNAVSGDLTNYKAVVERDYAKNSSVYTKNEVVNLTNNSKDSAVNAIKNDTNWKGLININTNASFLQNADGFAQEVSKRITNDTGQTNLYYNSEFTYTGNDPHNIDGIHSTRNAYSRNGRWANYKGSNSVFASTRGSLNDYFWIEQKKDKYVNVNPGEIVSASVVTWVTGGSDVPRDGYAICSIAFYKDLTSSRLSWKEVSVAAKDINYPNFRTLKVENVTVPDEANYMALQLIIRGSSNWQFSQPMLVRDSHVGVYVPSTQLQLNQVIDTADSHTRTITDYLTGSNSRFTQLSNAVNLKVAKGDVIGQINLEAGKTLLQNQKIYLDADTVTFSGKAFIPSAAISNLDAGKITTGTLNAANVKVINLDANNIRTGTLTGPGMALDLNNGSFKINNSDNSLKVEMDSGELRFYRQRNTKALTGTISASDWGFLSDNDQSLNLTGQSGAILKTEDFKMTNLFVNNGFFLTTTDVPSSNGSAVILHNNDVKIIGQTDSQTIASRISILAGKPYTYKTGPMTNVEYTGIDIIGDEDKSGKVSIAGGSDVNISAEKSKVNLYLGFSSISASVADSTNYDDITQKSEIKIYKDSIFFNFKKDKETSTPLALYNGGTLSVKDLSVWGSKNAIVQTTAGWTKINAYETAEYFFGDLGATNTGANSLVRIDIDPIFKETVNTTMQYQVFLTSYGPGYAWVSERTENYFVIESNAPNLEVGYEIKAKRKGYEGVRLEIDRNMEDKINE